MVGNRKPPRRPAGRKPTITPVQKDRIRRRIAEGELGVALASEYGVSPTRISQIKHEETGGSDNGDSS